ncbi:MAG: lipoyl(octanoyl) transferase LipB [Deltaproteobacteria bacterium]|nr:lipoyl(octanoyl) transferase LipB [Deltaproteobacteria bacterium]
MFNLCDIGTSDYQSCFDLQLLLRKKRQEEKIPNFLLFTEHPAVYTMGKQDASADLLNLSPIPLIKTNRGGRITYHGPGQLVGYFMVSLSSLKMNIPQFVSSIEELLIHTLSHWDIKANRDAEYPGVWVGQEKIAALGLHFDHGVSMHGFALNLHPQLQDYEAIIPCGIQGRGVTSMEKILNKRVEKNEVMLKLVESLAQVFQKKIQWIEKMHLITGGSFF